MSNETADSSEDTPNKTPGWVWGVGGALVAAVVAVLVIIPLVAVVIIAFLTILGTSINQKFETVGQTVERTGGGSMHLVIAPEA